MHYEFPIETERLFLRPACIEDNDVFYGMDTDSEIMEFVGDGSIKTESKEQAKEGLARYIAKSELCDYGLLAVIEKSSDTLIGWCGLEFDPFLNDIEIGYRFVKDAWGKGYATESGREIVRQGFEVLSLEKIVACTHPQHTASIRVLEKLGFKHIEDRYHPVAKIIAPVYKIANSL
jgi:ribosomal-protein-alanine N-acetyltransferase